MWLHITCISDKTKGPQELARTKEGGSSLNLIIQAGPRNQGVGGGSSSRLSYLGLWLWVGMLVILCIEQVREVRGSEQIHYFALLRSNAFLSMMMLFLVEKIGETRLTLCFIGAFFLSHFQQCPQAHRNDIPIWSWWSPGFGRATRAHPRSVFISL